MKKISETDAEKRVAYEVSVGKIEVVDEEYESDSESGEE